MIKMIVRGAEALSKAYRAGAPFDMKVRFYKADAGVEDRVVTEHFAPGETTPFAVMEMIGEHSHLAGGAIQSMLLPTLKERMVAMVDYQKVMVSLRSFEIDGKIMTIKELYGIDPFGGG